MKFRIVKDHSEKFSAQINLGMFFGLFDDWYPLPGSRYNCNTIKDAEIDIENYIKSLKPLEVIKYITK